MVLFVYRELVGLGSSLGIYTYAGKEFSSNRSGEKTKEERQKEIEKQKQILRTNISLALYYCYKLTKGDAEHEPEAASAPHTYYPYFWDILSAAEEEGPRWEAFFERALDLVKVCDAVYFYTTSGIPEDGDLSEGIEKNPDYGSKPRNRNSAPRCRRSSC